MADFDRAAMLDMFIYEMNQLIESFEQTVLKAEQGFESNDINEIFRIMHTIKGSAAMMLFDDISSMAHVVEDMFFYIREENPVIEDSSEIADVILEGMDFVKVELSKIESGQEADGNCDDLKEKIKVVLNKIKGVSTGATSENAKTTEVVGNNSNDNITRDDSFVEFIKNNERIADKNLFEINIFLLETCEMKNIRAYTTISNFEILYPNTTFLPENILDVSAVDDIEKSGFFIKFNTEHKMEDVIDQVFKSSYTSSINIKTIIQGDTLTPIDQLNKFSVKITFDENGYGAQNASLFNNLSILELEADYINIKNICIENTTIGDLIVEIYSTCDKEILSQAIDKMDGVKSYEVNEISVNSNTETKLENPKDNEVIVTNATVQTIQTPASTAETPKTEQQKADGAKKAEGTSKPAPVQVISVNVSKLDQLLNLMGELVISEAMVTQNPELEGLELESFRKETRQLRKIINDVQDIVMSMRMVPLSSVFFKMNRIVRDMSKQLAKDVDLVIIGEETEVDKNIIEHISDPLMHMIRNSIDHGIESDEERELVGKKEKGTVVLEAKNAGGDVQIIIKDNGAGIDPAKVLAKAKKNNLLSKAETEYTDKEIQQFIFLPGFSTNEEVTNYSGRGVGMDVVVTNLQMVGGSVEVDSVVGKGSEFVLKIPLTLAIIEGMIIKISGSKYTIPIISINQSFKAKNDMIHVDPSGNEMITVRGEIYNLIRLDDFFGLERKIKNVEDGITIIVENGNKKICLLADELVGEYQVVVKSLPKYIKNIRSLSGCTLLGNGEISLIIDTAGFFNK